MSRGRRSYPAWLWVPVGIGALFVLLPIISIVVHVDWAHFLRLIGSPSSVAALRLSLETAAMSTALHAMWKLPLTPHAPTCPPTFRLIRNIERSTPP